MTISIMYAIVNLHGLVISCFKGYRTLSVSLGIDIDISHSGGYELREKELFYLNESVLETSRVKEIRIIFYYLKIMTD